jgi:hypothetical protein
LLALALVTLLRLALLALALVTLLGLALFTLALLALALVALLRLTLLALALLLSAAFLCRLRLLGLLTPALAALTAGTPAGHVLRRSKCYAGHQGGRRQQQFVSHLSHRAFSSGFRCSVAPRYRSPYGK